MPMPSVESRASATSAFGHPLHKSIMDNWDRTLIELWNDKSMRAESLFYQRNIVYPEYGDISEYSQTDKAAAIHGEKALNKLWDDDWWDNKALNRLPYRHDDSIRVLDPYEVVALSTSSPVPLAFDYTMSEDTITVSGTKYAHFAPSRGYSTVPVSGITLYDLGVWWYSVRRFAQVYDELLTVGELATLFNPELYREDSRILAQFPEQMMGAVSEYRAIMPEDEALMWAVLSTWGTEDSQPAVKKGELYIPAREVYNLARSVDVHEVAMFVMAGIRFSRVQLYIGAGLGWERAGQYIKNGFTDIPVISRFIENGIDADMAAGLAA